MNKRHNHCKNTVSFNVVLNIKVENALKKNLSHLNVMKVYFNITVNMSKTLK